MGDWEADPYLKVKPKNLFIKPIMMKFINLIKGNIDFVH